MWPSPSLPLRAESPSRSSQPRARPNGNRGALTCECPALIECAPVLKMIPSRSPEPRAAAHHAAGPSPALLPFLVRLVSNRARLSIVRPDPSLRFAVDLCGCGRSSLTPSGECAARGLLLAQSPCAPGAHARGGVVACVAEQEQRVRPEPARLMEGGHRHRGCAAREHPMSACPQHSSIKADGGCSGPGRRRPRRLLRRVRHRARHHAGVPRARSRRRAAPRRAPTIRTPPCHLAYGFRYEN
eukprot:SAG11_NODE_3116_length_2674_cov_4.690097_2_plen_242_part_00